MIKILSGISLRIKKALLKFLAMLFYFHEFEFTLKIYLRSKIHHSSLN